MALPNVPKTNWESDDGATFTDMNEIGENIQDLEDDKIETGDTVTALTITTATLQTANITTLNTSGATNPGLTASTSIAIGAGAVWTPARGNYIVSVTGASLQINVGGWRNVNPGTGIGGGAFFTDGSNVRILDSGSGTTAFYHKY